MEIEAIGRLLTPFREKFGVPRQSLLLPDARGILKLNPDPNYEMALRHLEQFSHIWIIFVFHKSLGQPWKPLIEIPRVEAGRRMGVFASRSPLRPNPLGMSAVKLERIDYQAKDGIELHLSGVDILDDTPVIDIKPYLPYADRIDDANSGWVKSDIKKFPVDYSPESLEQLKALADERMPALIEQMLELDPRPTSQRRSTPIGDPATEGMRFAFRLLNWDVHWEVRQGRIFVIRLDQI